MGPRGIDTTRLPRGRDEQRSQELQLGAASQSIPCTVRHHLTTGTLYRDPGGDYFRKRDPERITKRLVAQLEALGHAVTLYEAAAARA